MGNRKQPTPVPPGAIKPKAPPAPPEKRQSATQSYKAGLRGQVDRACYRKILKIANDILSKLPKSEGLGDTAAALMLAATAYSESAGQAHRLLEVSNDPQN